LCSLYPKTKACAIQALVTSRVCCLHLAGAVLLKISPIAAHNTTGFVKCTPTILYQGTNLYLRNFWYFWPNLSQVQNCSLIQNCIVGVCFTKSVLYSTAMGNMAGKTASAKCTQHTSHMVSALIALLLYLSKGNTDLSYVSCIW